MVLKNDISNLTTMPFKLSGIPKKEESTEQINRKLSKIRSKLASGKKLSASELSFLQENNMTLYQTALRVMRERTAFEERLKNCNSKEEVHETIGNALSGMNSKDPDFEYVMAAKQDAIKEFQKSDDYDKLPDRSKNDKQRKERNGIPTGLYNRHGKTT